MSIQINKHIDYFVKYVVSKDNQECFLSFKNSPFLKTQEGYKDSIAADFTKAFNKLNFQSKNVGTGKLLSMVKQQLLSTQNNLVFVNQKIHFNNIALEKPNEVELFLYQLYYTHDDENSADLKNNPIPHWKLYYLKRNHMHMLIKHYPKCVINDYIFQLRCTVGAWLHHPQMNVYEEIERKAMWDAFWHRMGKSKKYHP